MDIEANHTIIERAGLSSFAPHPIIKTTSGAIQRWNLELATCLQGPLEVSSEHSAKPMGSQTSVPNGPPPNSRLLVRTGPDRVDDFLNGLISERILGNSGDISFECFEFVSLYNNHITMISSDLIQGLRGPSYPYYFFHHSRIQVFTPTLW